MQREAVNILIGTPAKVTEVMTTRGGLQGGEVRTLIVSFSWIKHTDCQLTI